MNADRQVPFRRQLQLGQENFLLSLVRQAGFPAVQPDLAHGRRQGFQMFQKTLLPRRGPIPDVPWMIPKTGQHFGMGPRQGQHRRPVLFAGAIDHHPHRAHLPADLQQLGLPAAKAIVLKVVVGVVQTHGQSSMPRGPQIGPRPAVHGCGDRVTSNSKVAANGVSGRTSTLVT